MLRDMEMRQQRDLDRLSSTALMLRMLEQQLRDELAEASALAEAQRRSAALANARKPVPQCVIERLETVSAGRRAPRT